MGESSGKILSNSVWVIIQHVYSMLTSVVLVALIARHLGPSDYGMINYCASVIAIFSTLSGLGLDNVIISEIIKKPEKESVYLGTALVMRLVSTLVSYPLILAFIALINPGNSALIIVAALQAMGMVFQSYEVLVYRFRIKLQMKFVSLALIIAITVAAVLRIVLLVRKAPVVWFAMAISLQALVAGIVVVIFFFRKSKVRLTACFADAKALLKLSYNFIISGFSIIIYMEADKIILGKMTDSAHVGIYSAAVLLATCWQFVPTALIDSSRPVVLEKRKISQQEYLKQFKLVMAGVNLMALLFSVLVSCLGWLFISLVYGSSYTDADIPLIILSGASFIGITGYTRTIWITGEGYYKYEKYFAMSAALLNIVLDILFIWKMGIIGAAAATFITYVYEVLIVPLFFKETRVFTRLYFESFGLIPEFIGESAGVIRRVFGKK